MDYEVVIGLEVHAQLATQSKIFCGCSTAFGAPPNTQTCPVCLGMPGVLPVLNRRAAEFAIKTALACHGEVVPRCRFARKNYFYPDMPKNYQISQYDEPLIVGGYVEVPTPEGMKRIRLVRIHLEEDVGKSIHGEHLDDPRASYVDFNRSGVPLMEIVSEPDLSSPEEAKLYLQRLRTILQYLAVCDGNMEEGSLRCDANVSLRPRGAREYGTKVEIKNMNSFRNVQRALEYEVIRQGKALDAGEKLVQETRLWDANRGVTRAMRSKEFAHDYRYFPEPDLVPLTTTREWVEDIRRTLPELPDARMQRFVAEYGIPEYDAGVLTSSKALADYYEACITHYPKPKVVSNWIMVELLRALNRDGLEVEQSRVTPENLAALLSLVDDGTISGTMAKTVFDAMYETGKTAAEVVREKGLRQISDEHALVAAIEEVIANNPTEVEEFRNGRDKLLGFFMGQVMKATQGKANPQAVNKLLREKLTAR
ncbi:MAG TPA: Asp-tRNA(Asn)/Glu-tRNA(Gln) amidotransferase subunit GatB [Candidatus Tectomicrobia bacterium]|nr:Asp-tRNA(Asn)/Glu-tRNA(Gln) amidotransferase subunit GatB [Candidatus Tectomicrobia bacterium]